MEQLTITTLDGLHAVIKPDGTVLSADGKTLGFINEDGTAGDSDQKFLGEINQDGTIIDANDKTLGYIDLGKSTLRDELDSHFATLSGNGDILDKYEVKRAHIKNFNYKVMKVVASYLLFFDKSLLSNENIDTSSLGGTGTDETSIDKEELRLMKHLKFGKGSAPKIAPGKKEPPKTQAPKTTTPPKTSTAPPKTTTAPPKTTTAPPKTTTTPPKTQTVTSPPKLVETKTNQGEVISETNDQGLLDDPDEKARKEAERMQKAMGFVPKETTSVQKTSSPSTTGDSKSYPIPKQPQTQTMYEVSIWSEVNRVRQNPSQFVQLLKDMIPNFEGNNYVYPGNTKIIRQTSEGIAAVNEAITFLEKCAPKRELKLSNGLSLSGRDFVQLLVNTTNFGNVETDSEASKRLSRYGSWHDKLLQNIALGDLSPTDTVISWIIDDGNKNRDHRNAIFSNEINIAGVASGPHVSFTRSVVLLVAGDYKEGGEVEQKTSESEFDVDAPVVSAATNYEVGKIRSGDDGYSIDISNLGCPGKALKLDLIEQGNTFSFRRLVKVGDTLKENNEKLRMPFSTVASNVSADYNEQTGTLTINIRTGSSGSEGSYEVANFKVTANSQSKVDSVDVNSTSNSDSFVFVCEPSRFDTDVAVTLKGKILTFNTSYIFEKNVEGKNVEVKKKSESTFTLPFSPESNQIVVTPNPGKGQQIKIMKSVSTNVSQKDVEIPINVK